MRMILLPLTIVCSLWPAIAFAQSQGNGILDACKRFISEERTRTTLVEASKEGECYGVVSAAVMYSNLLGEVASFCPPKGYNMGQATRIVINYMEKHPEKLHMVFAYLALMALDEAWPCKSP